ncbi:MAG: hypothetical protein HY762_07285 [Planctomycetes bacterium]|nr:hypothetical protein [Planctomycetota bacterium]
MKTTTSPFGDKLTQDNLFNIQGNVVNVVVANAVAWGIPAPDVAALVAERAIYEPLYHKSQNKNTRTRADVAAHKLAAEQYLKKLRLFWHKWIEDGDMPTEEKLLLGGDLLDTELTPRGKINDVPYVKLTAMGGGDVRVRLTIEEDQTKSNMHPLADEVECKYTFVPTGEMPPEDTEATGLKTHGSPKARFIISCGVKNAGQSFWGFFRWVNKSNPANSGQWTTKPLGVVIA